MGIEPRVPATKPEAIAAVCWRDASASEGGRAGDNEARLAAGTLSRLTCLPRRHACASIAPGGEMKALTCCSDGGDRKWHAPPGTAMASGSLPPLAPLPRFGKSPDEGSSPRRKFLHTAVSLGGRECQGCQGQAGRLHRSTGRLHLRGNGSALI